MREKTENVMREALADMFGLLALAVRDYIDDPDGYPTKAFDHFIVDCRSKDEPVFWDEMI